MKKRNKNDFKTMSYRKQDLNDHFNYHYEFNYQQPDDAHCFIDLSLYHIDK